MAIVDVAVPVVGTTDTVAMVVAVVVLAMLVVVLDVGINAAIVDVDAIAVLVIPPMHIFHPFLATEESLCQEISPMGVTPSGRCKPLYATPFTVRSS